MHRKLHFIDVPKTAGQTPEAVAPPPDRWPPEADEMAEQFLTQRHALLQGQRLDRVAGIIIVAGLAVLVVMVGGRGMSLAAAIIGMLLAGLYVPVRGNPRRDALAEIDALLEIVDPRCLMCGYALRHLPSSRCPECGRRAALPSRDVIAEAIAGGPVTVTRASVQSELGWIVLLLMVLAATIAGRFWGAQAAWYAMAVPPLFVLSWESWTRWRRASRVMIQAVCNACGQVSSGDTPACPKCRAPRRAEHVYVKPGLRGSHDPRLYVVWARVGGGILVAAMLILLGAVHGSVVRGRFGENRTYWLFFQPLLFLGAIACILLDERRRSKSRLTAYDHAVIPLCHHCLSSLQGAPASGECQQCFRKYEALELAGGRAPAKSVAVRLREWRARIHAAWGR